MTREDVIRWAREAAGGLESEYANISALERFAALVAAAERASCARVCELRAGFEPENTALTLHEVAEVIRARGTE